MINLGRFIIRPETFSTRCGRLALADAYDPPAIRQLPSTKGEVCLEYIDPSLIRRQAWKFYVCLLAWPLYLFLIPYTFHLAGWWSLLFMIFPGVWLFTWVAYLMHESWHKYVPNLPGDLFYYLFAFMLITDPQIYRLAHGAHHGEVHTWKDVEFHPWGKIESVPLRRIYNLMEIIFGSIFLQTLTTLILPFRRRFETRYRLWLALVSPLVWLIFLGGLGWGAQHVFGLAYTEVEIPYMLTYFLGAFIQHHSQLMEHGNLIVEGEWEKRSIKTRNLRRRGVLERLFLFLTHGDSQEHILHHTLVQVYSRPFPGMVPLPGDAVFITLVDYAKILGEMINCRED